MFFIILQRNKNTKKMRNRLLARHTFSIISGLICAFALMVMTACGNEKSGKEWETKDETGVLTQKKGMNQTREIDSMRRVDPLAKIREDGRFEIICANPITPVKSQGSTSLCWVYAMLATIESNHIAMGDSVQLSAKYIMRKRLEQLCDRYYLTKGASRFTDRGTLPSLLELLNDEGAMAYNAYGDEDFNAKTLISKLKMMVKGSATQRKGLQEMRETTAKELDGILGPAPRFVFMLGAEYTAKEFAHSICRPNEYKAYTSFSHHPFGEMVALELPDNWENHRFMNIPIDSMEQKVISALQNHRSVAWEGDTSERGFSFSKGLAVTGKENKGEKSEKAEQKTETAGTPSSTIENDSLVTLSIDKKEDSENLQTTRQRAFEESLTTDDHCMEIFGMARDKKTNQLFFICKNSWGTGNRYGGLMLMSIDYFRMKTIAVVL